MRSRNPQKGAKMGDFYDIDPPKRGRDERFFKSVEIKGKSNWSGRIKHR
jgi:hypothetical protein